MYVKDNPENFMLTYSPGKKIKGGKVHFFQLDLHDQEDLKYSWDKLYNTHFKNRREIIFQCFAQL